MNPAISAGMTRLADTAFSHSIYPRAADGVNHYRDFCNDWRAEE
jgi:hypothetical protein